MGKSNIATIAAGSREAVGTSAAKRLRANGQVPAVLYGHGEDTIHLSVDAHELWMALEHKAYIVELSIPDGAQQALIKDVQYDIYQQSVLHADFTRVSLDETIEVEVPIELHGSVKEATVEHVHHTLPVFCRADNIPDSLVAEIAGMVPGDVLHLSDIELPEGVETELPLDTVIVSVQELQDLEELLPEEEEAVEGVEAAEPELIGEEPEEEGEEETEETAAEEEPERGE